MPNIILEKDGRRYVFGLHTDKSVMSGNNITVPFNGVNYYARIGDENTPLKVQKNGRWYSVQYNPLMFETFARQYNVTNGINETFKLFMPKGRYRFYLIGNSSRTIDATVSDSREVTIIINVTKTVNLRNIKFTAEGVTDATVQNSSNTIEVRIERIGD